jgi:hypothetical protein
VRAVRPEWNILEAARKQLEVARRDELVIAQMESSRRSPGDKYIMARGGPEMEIHYPLIVVYHTPESPTPYAAAARKCLAEVDQSEDNAYADAM